MERWEGEREDDCQNRTGDVTKQKWHEGWNFPVLALSYNHVQVATNLVTLEMVSIQRCVIRKASLTE